MATLLFVMLNKFCIVINHKNTGSTSPKKAIPSDLLSEGIAILIGKLTRRCCLITWVLCEIGIAQLI